MCSLPAQPLSKQEPGSGVLRRQGSKGILSALGLDVGRFVTMIFQGARLGLLVWEHDLASTTQNLVTRPSARTSYALMPYTSSELLFKKSTSSRVNRTSPVSVRHPSPLPIPLNSNPHTTSNAAYVCLIVAATLNYPINPFWTGRHTSYLPLRCWVRLCYAASTAQTLQTNRTQGGGLRPPHSAASVDSLRPKVKFPMLPVGGTAATPLGGSPNPSPRDAADVQLRWLPSLRLGCQ